jgi:hypothetical protein
MSQADAFAEIVAEIRQELTTATEALMAAYEAGLRDVALARGGDDAALSRIEGGFICVLETCAFEDLIGQRLTQLCSASAQTAPPRSEPEGLENGPARYGGALDQTEVDTWLRGQADPRTPEPPGRGMASGSR